MKKRFLSAVLAGVTATAMLMAGCGSSEAPAAAETEKASEAVQTEAAESDAAAAGTEEKADVAGGEVKELTYWSMWNSTEGQAKVIQEAADAYEQETGVHINIEWKGRDIKTLIGPALDAGEDVDIFDTDYMMLTQQNDKYLADLTEMAAAADYEKHVMPILLENAKEWSNGKLKVMPYQPYTTGIWYDKAMFENAGVTETPETFDK